MNSALRAITTALAVLAIPLAAAGCGDDPVFPNRDELDVLRNLHTMSVRPPPDPTNRLGDDPVAAALGTELFHDPALSRCGNVSCSSCHAAESGTVPEAFGTGCDGQLTGRNPPTIINAGYYNMYMWDGRADRLWSQAILPFLSPIEMASSPAILRARLSEAYSGPYQDLFGKSAEETSDDELLANFGKVISAYERNLNRTRAPFDETVKRFLAAVDNGTETEDPAFLGLKVFVRKGRCGVCHSGPALTDNLFHNIALEDEGEGRGGAMLALPDTFTWKFNSSGAYSDAPKSLYSSRLLNLEAEFNEKYDTFVGAFRTPSLRNVTLTAPYMHTGALATLEDVVDFYDRGGDKAGTFQGTRTETIGELELTDEEKTALVELLKSMTAED